MNLEAKRGITQDDERFMALALAERANSDDPKAATVSQSGVGAIVVAHGQVIARSANVLPPTLREHRILHGLQIEEADRYHLIEHAERAVIYKALIEGHSLQRATMYCTRSVIVLERLFGLASNALLSALGYVVKGVGLKLSVRLVKYLERRGCG